MKYLILTTVFCLNACSVDDPSAHNRRAPSSDALVCWSKPFGKQAHCTRNGKRVEPWDTAPRHPH